MGSSSGKLSTDDLNYLLANTNFDKPTIQQWFKGFKVKEFKTKYKKALLDKT